MNKIKRTASLLSFMTLGLLAGCSSTDTANNGTKNSNVILNSDPSQLSKRMDYSNSGAISITPAPGGKMETDAPTFTLTQVSEVLPPVDANGLTLQATHVTVNGNYAYVAYAEQGAVYSGAIDVIDVTDPTNPKLIMAALVPNTDINAINYSNGKLLMAASTDVDKRVGLKTPSIAMDMQLSSGLLTTTCTESDLYGYSTTDIAGTTSAYFAVSGDNGKLFKVDNTTDQVLGSVPMNDLRSVGLYNDQIITLSGTNGINIYNSADLSLTKSFSSWTDNAQGAKRAIDFYNQQLLCPEGSNGLSVYDITSGNKLQSFPLTQKDGIDPADIVTNAVSVNSNIAFVANGALGVDVLQAGTSSFTKMGTLNLNGSCNYVKSSGNYIYAADGTGGLKIIRMDKPATAPAYCTGLPAYTGDPNLNVNSGQNLGYSGTTTLGWVNVNAPLTLCGTTTIQNDININSGGLFKMYGTLTQGNSTSSNFNLNGEIQIEGSVVISGNLTMNSGAKLTFLGSNSSITVNGKVTKNSGVTISGTYTNTDGKVK